MYIDKLLVMLRTLGIGCHIGSAYIDALSYADDSPLRCPSIRELNEIMVLCNYNIVRHIVFISESILDLTMNLFQLGIML